MKFRIHFELDDGEDSIVVEGATVEDVQATAQAEVEKRGGKYPWSEPVQ